MDALRGHARSHSTMILCCIAAIGASAQARSATLTVLVSDRDGASVPEVVVYAVPQGGAPSSARSPSPAVAMDQLDQQFTPHVLAVQTGSTVEFPNHDTVSHHVYSFSRAKPFELPLYKGTAHPPVVFDRPGVVDLGCNIHDHMEAHIVVVDTPYFAVTGADGRAALADLPTGRYSVRIYTPRLRSDALPPPLDIDVEAAGTGVEVRIEARLGPPHARASGSLDWSHY